MSEPPIGPWLPDVLQGLPARVLLPERYEPHRERYPLVVFLHGSAERGRDNAAQLKNGVRAFEAVRRAIVVAPQCDRDDTFGGSWYGGPSRTQTAVVELVQELASRRSVDADRVALIGFSMGAIGLWELVSRHRELFACAVPIAGDLEPATADALKGFPVWAFHGERDALVPNANTRAAMKRLAGGPARYTELPGEGHDIAQQVLERADLQEWLFAQRR